MGGFLKRADDGRGWDCPGGAAPTIPSQSVTKCSATLICHSDLHQARAEWAGTQWPCVPGHKIVGHVPAVGGRVSGLRVGDLVGIGCIVDSCRHCDDCADGLENYCDGMVGTCNFPTPNTPGHTLGGCSQRIAVQERYVLRIRHPEEQLATVAPLLCAFTTSDSKPIAGSMIGGIPETQEMLDFCAGHGIVADIELIRADAITEAYERMLKGDVKYQFVTDTTSLTF